MRCPDCNKFVAYDTDQDPEVESDPELVKTDDELHFTTSYRRILPCGDCGTELKEGTIEIDHVVEGLPDKDDLLEEGVAPHEHEWFVDNTDAQASTNAVGRGRGMKTFYGVDLCVTLKCEHENCDAEFEFECAGELQASCFDEVV